MKTAKFIRTIPAALLVLTAPLALATVISFNDMPAPAKREAETELKTGTLKKVESVDYHGRTIYALTFQKPDGSPRFIYLNADGTYVHDQDVAKAVAGGTSATASPANARGQDVQLSQVPQAVQRTIQTETKNGPVARILQSTQNGNTTYEVFFSQPNGQQKIIYLNPNGTYVQPGNVGTPGAVGRSWDTLSSSGSGQRLGNQRQLSLSELPAAAQSAFRSEAGTSDIRNIQSIQLNGQAAYQANINRNGQQMLVRVDPNGRVLSATPLQNSTGAYQR
jgi:hypothetical protein